MEHFGFLFAAYSIIFAAIFLYVLFLGRRQNALEIELRALEARLASMRPEEEPQQVEIERPGEIEG
jgi:CcmD family protein